MKKLLLASAALLALSSQAQAYDQNTILFGLGADNILDSSGKGNNKTLGGRVEWRGKSFDNVAGVKHISPIAGVEADFNKSGYVYAGLAYDWNFYDGWSLVPSVALGAYHKGDGKNLGGTFEFHDSVEVNYKITPASRVGVAFTHMSNAGIYSHNPGKEDLMATYSVAY